MFNFSIGLRGLQIAQRAIELIGTNLSNAATEGYHRQEMSISPVEFDGIGRVVHSALEIGSATRQIDLLLEQEMTRQQPQIGQVQQELDTLKSIEGALGNVDTEGLGQTLSNFFNAMRELASDSDSPPLLQQVVGAAEELTSQFHTLASFVEDLNSHIRHEAQATTEAANTLISEIASLNHEINRITAGGGNSNLLRDRRDEAINELGQLIDVQVNDRTQPNGMVNVAAWGTPLVMGDQYTELEIGSNVGTAMGISVKGAGFYQSDVYGGRVGGLLTLANDLLPEVLDGLNTLATEIMTQVNQLHVQGVGAAGSFSKLEGVPVGEQTLNQWALPIRDGTIQLRVIDPDGDITLHEVQVDADTDTVQTMAAKFDGIDHLSATLVNNCLSISSETGYKFDFVPALKATPSASTLSGTSTPTISGLYTGTKNQTYTAKVLGDGEIGVTQGLTVEVFDGANSLVKRLIVGHGYVAGSPLEVHDGIFVSFSSGTLKADETFDIKAIANSDTSGFLSAAGMNTFFKGTSASTIELRDEIASDPQRIAASRGGDGSDNGNVLLLAELAQQALGGLGNVSLQEYFRRLVVDNGQNIALRQGRLAALETVTQQLTAQRDNISGVDVNEESAKLLMFERMFQSMSKFIGTQDKAMQMLMDLV